MQAFIPPVPLLCTSQSTQQNQCQRPQTSFTSFKHHLPYHLAVTTCQTIRAQETLFLSDDNVNKALEEVRVKLGSVFGNSADNRAVGITGEVELVELDGPVVVLRLRGRFWHKRADVVSVSSNSCLQFVNNHSSLTIDSDCCES